MTQQMTQWMVTDNDLKIIIEEYEKQFHECVENKTISNIEKSEIVKGLGKRVKKIIPGNWEPEQAGPKKKQVITLWCALCGFGLYLETTNIYNDDDADVKDQMVFSIKVIKKAFIHTRKCLSD